MSMSIAAARPDGRTLFTEKLVIEPQRYPMRQTGVMDSFDVFGNVILCTPKDNADRIHAVRGGRGRPCARRGVRRLPTAQ